MRHYFGKTSLHLDTFNQFQIRFKPVLRVKNAMQRWFVTCFRDVTTHIIAVPRTLHLWNQTVLCYWVYCWS